MAIFGTLEDLSLIEVLPTLTRRNGRLLISGLPSGLETEIHINATMITALLVNQRPLELVDAHRYFHELVGNRIGNFEFFNERPEGIVRHFEIGVFQLLTGRFELADAKESDGIYYPDAKTRFVTTDRTLDSFLGFELDDFWIKSYSFLLSGANAEELSQQCQLPLLQTQSYLYRLRASGRIQPLRAFARTAPSQEFEQTRNEPARTNQQNMPELSASPISTSLPVIVENNSVNQNLNPVHQEKTNSTLEQPKRTIGILGKLISALGFRK
jgi:hypothetical protein